MNSVSTSSTRPTYRVVNPATGATVEEFSTAMDEEVAEALGGSHTAYANWSSFPVNARAAVLSRASELFHERSEELARIIAEEMGKPLAQGLGEIQFCADIFAYYAKNGARLCADEEIPVSSGRKAIIQRRPLGVLLGIMPWNYPYYQAARFVAPNLLLGNTVLLKPAESCPRSAAAFQQLLTDAGLTAGAYRHLLLSHEQIARVISDQRVQGVSLTGSERAGAAVARTSGENLKKVVLELGGSDAHVVLDTADIKSSAETAWQMRMENMGQACNSNKRIIVNKKIFDDYVAELVQLAKDLVPGNPLEMREDSFAPMSSRSAAEGLQEQVDDAISKGAVLHVGGILPDHPGAYFAPAVLTGVTPQMRAYHEELFGPVAVVYQAEDEQDALRLAADTEFGLGAAVFSQDEERAITFAQQLDTGMVSVNAPAAEGAELPFGGVKKSGYGRELGPLGIDEFVNKRLMYIA